MKRFLFKKQVLVFFFLLIAFKLFSQPFIEQTGISLPAVSESSAAWGDYDNDGDLDILLTGSSSSGIISKIFKNNGDNSFIEQTGISLTGVSQGSVCWGDYDNDGDLDILITGFTLSSSISKIYRNNSDNSFTVQNDILLPGVGISSVAWGDYDNDGDLDILMTGMANYGNITKIYRNNGDNTFDEFTGISLPDIRLGSAVWGDYDNDGNLDFLLTGNNNSTIYRNNGNNTFTEQTTIELVKVSFSSAAWGDYDNDGDLDVIISGSNSSSQNVSKLYRNNGDNTFTEQSEISLKGFSFGTISWGDYDNDGNLDILMTGHIDANHCESIIYHNNGNNTFTEKTDFNLKDVEFGSAVWGDYDNDGDLDILLTGNDYSPGLNSYCLIYRNEIINPNTKPLVPNGLQSYWENESIVFRWNKSSDNSTPVEALRYNLRIGTSPGGNEIKSGQALTNGKLLISNLSNLITDTCIVYKLPFNKYYWSVQTVDNGLMASSFEVEQTTPLDSIQAKDLKAFIRNENSLLIRWKNGNGLHRVVFGRISDTAEIARPVNGIDYFAEQYFGLGDKIEGTGWYCLYNGSADSVMVYGLGVGYSYDIQVIEYVEIKGSPEYFFVLGKGNPGVFSSSLFSEQTGIGLIGVNNASVAWGDYNNDGYLDILMESQSSLKIYCNNSNNTFTEPTITTLPEAGSSSAAWCDFDNDGDLDILATGSGFFSKLCRNNGNNSFTDIIGITIVGVISSSVALGDYNNDGNIDILLTGSTYSGSEPITRIYRNDGNNNFTEQTEIVLTDVILGSVDWGDYDNDGNLDILLTGSTEKWPNYAPISKVYHNDGNNNFTEQTGIMLTQVFYSSAIWGDYDNDGNLDILITGATGNSANYSPISKIYHNNGNNSFTEQSGILLPKVFNSSTSWGDYDNDGDLDIILHGYTGSTWISKIYRNDGNNSFNEQTGIALAGGMVGTTAWGDYDNDGDLDLLIGSKLYRNNTFMNAGNYFINNKPATPERLSSISQPNGITLTWAPVKTDETLYKTMTYNVKIGTSKNNTNICSSHSRDDGYRQIAAMGNAQLDTTIFLKSLPPNKYYWRVQAVDQGYMGSEWSVVDSFEVKNVQTFFSSDEVCLDLATHFTDQSVATDGIASWLWDFNDGETSSDQNPSHVYSSSGTFNVKLVITDINGVKDSLVQAVVVKAKPVADFSAPAVCQGTAATITNTSNKNGFTVSSWYWDFGDGQTSLTEQPPAHGYLGAANYTVSLKALAENGCMDTITKIVTVASYPVAAVTANAPLSFCKGDSVTLSVPFNHDYLFSWKIDGTSLTGADSSKFVAKLSGSYVAEVVNSKANCTTSSSATSIIAQDAPAAPFIIVSGTQTFCQGDSVVLNVTNTSGYSYQWKLNGGAVGIDSNQYIARNSGTYSVTVSNSNRCSITSTNSITVTVNPLPVVGALSLNGKSKFCSGESLTLSVPSVAGYLYSWKDEAGPITGAVTNSFVATRSGEFQLEVSNTSGCKVITNTAKVEVLEMPVNPTIDERNYSKGMCLGETPLKLSVDGFVEGYNYKWFKNGAFLSNETFIEVSEGGNYYLEASLDICTSTRDSLSISFMETLPKPVVIPKGPTVWYLSTASKASYYKWYYNGSLIPDAVNNVYVAGQNLGIYRLAISNDNQCFAFSDTIRIPIGVTGIENTDPFTGLKIYPNPTTGLFTIEMDNNVFGELVIDVFNQHGSKTLNIEFEKTTGHFKSQIDLSGQSKGMYIINLAIKEYTATRKLVVE